MDGNITKTQGEHSRTQTPLRIKYAKVEDDKVEELMFCILQDDGELVDTDCVECAW